MPNSDLFFSIFCISAPFVLFFLSSVKIKRIENSVRSFYLPLREKYPRSYLRLNKVVKFVRKICKMDVKGTFHWMTCVCHYLQIFIILSPISILFMILFVSFSKAVNMWLCLVIGPLFFTVVWLSEIQVVIEASRCEKIKKTNPEYSKKEVIYWKRR